MICIERDGNHYKLKVSDIGFGGYSMQAKTVNEATNAVRHYYGEEHDTSDCASCRQIEKVRETGNPLRTHKGRL